MASISDIFLYNQYSSGSTYGFVQFGWYVGNGGPNLPYVTFPHVFWGENDSVQTEILYAPGIGLNYNTAHTFKIIQDANDTGVFNFYLDDVYRGHTTGAHTHLNNAAFVAENNDNSVALDGIAQAPQTPINTLEYHRSGAWFLFSDGSYYVTPSGANYNSYRISGEGATDHAFGPGTCT